MATTRICIHIDLDTANIEVAYRQVNEAMSKTGLDWESSDEWFYGDGKDIPEFVIAEARMRVLDAQAEPTKTPIDYVCEDCNGSEISVEAMVEFSPWNQEFIVHDTCDKGHYCSTCDGTCRLKEVDYHGDLDPAIRRLYAPPRGS